MNSGSVDSRFKEAAQAQNTNMKINRGVWWFRKPCKNRLTYIQGIRNSEWRPCKRPASYTKFFWGKSLNGIFGRRFEPMRLKSWRYASHHVNLTAGLITGGINSHEWKKKIKIMGARSLVWLLICWKDSAPLALRADISKHSYNSSSHGEISFALRSTSLVALHRPGWIRICSAGAEKAFESAVVEHHRMEDMGLTSVVRCQREDRGGPPYHADASDAALVDLWQAQAISSWRVQ